MDNAPYHSEQKDKSPSFSSKKDKMQEWLIKHNVYFDTKMTIKQLWDNNQSCKGRYLEREDQEEEEYLRTLFDKSSPQLFHIAAN